MSVVKDTILKMYSEHYEISEMLRSLDWSSLEVQFQKELDERISREDFDEATKLLASDLIFRYDQAVMQSVMAMTRQINDLLDLVTYQPTGRAN